MNNWDRYKSDIAEMMGLKKTQNIYFYWKGRVALYALLKAIELKPGDEVILPGFTCVVVPNAIKYLGAKPVYVDVEKNTMNTSLDRIRKAVTEITKVIIVQNTFGLSTEVDIISKFAREQKIFTIEDCTHGFGGTYKGNPNGSWCDAAFFSTQWNKPFSTGIGGFASVNNLQIISRLEKINNELVNPAIRDRIVLSVLLFAADQLLDSKNYWRLRAMYRFLSRHNLVVGSSQGLELKSTIMPKDYFKGISNVQIKKGLFNLKSFGEVLGRRKQNAILYTNFLQKHDKYHILEELHPDHSFLKYPILVKDRTKFDERAFKAKIQLGDWFCTPIYPVKDHWEKWDFDSDKVPNALYLARHIENLPTDTNDPEKVLDFLKINIEELI
jgi:perosamine synthetase